MKQGNLGSHKYSALTLAILCFAAAGFTWVFGQFFGVTEGHATFINFMLKWGMVFSAGFLIFAYYLDLRSDRWRFEAVKDMTAAIIQSEGGDSTRVSAKAVVLADLVCRSWGMDADAAMEFLNETKPTNA